MSKTNLILALFVLAAVSLSCTFLKGGSSSSAYGVGDIHNSPLPSVDDNEPFPAMSTDAINALVKELPELAKHREEILEAERSAINGILGDIREKRQNSNVGAVDSNLEFNRLPSGRADDNYISRFNLIPAAYAADDPPPIPAMGGVEFYMIGHQAGFFKDDAGKVNESERGQSRNVEMKDDAGTVQATLTKAIDKDTGLVSLELTTFVNMPVFGLNANSKVKLTGEQCPNPEGKVDLTVEYGTNGRAGSSASMIYDKTLTAKVRATVNDNAEIASMDIDLKQATRSTAGGRQVYVETSQSGRATSGNSSDLKFNDVRIDRASSQATAADADISRDGLSAAYLVARAVLDNAQSRWQEGGCVQIEAASPGNVAVNSTTQIPVKVTHKVDRSEVPSKLEAELSGGTSIDPTRIPKTAGTLTYVAPGESGRSATITLTATSRRGKAELSLDASTGGDSYTVSASSNGVSFSGKICSLSKPFTLDATFPGGKAVTTFSPDGSTATSGGGGGCTQTGSGSYSVDRKPDGSAALKWTSSDKLTCPMFGNSKTMSFSVPLEPAPGLSCN